MCAGSNRQNRLPASRRTFPFHRLIVAAGLLFLAAGGAVAQQNVLVNPGFESNPPSAFGNNIGYPIPPWTLGSGQTSNVVTVDGPGGLDYGSNGPESDASGTAAPKPQHYLDIADGSNTFYQVFTPRCSGSVRFGGSFSTRANSSGTARVEIHLGNTGPAGTLVGSTNAVTLPGGNSKTDPWTKVTFSVPVTAGQAYSFVVFMDNELNFDEGFVTYVENCPGADPCCPPWNTTTLQESLFYQGTAGIAAPYTLRFQPATLLSNQMQSYINYLNTVNAAITQITIEFRLHDAGTGATPVGGAQLGVSHYITWQSGLTTGGFPAPAFFSGTPETMVINHWYIVHTGIYLENNQRFFGDACANNDVAVRIEVRALSNAVAPRAVLVIRDAMGHVVERPLASR
jgi:hypothetical protein